MAAMYEEIKGTWAPIYWLRYIDIDFVWSSEQERVNILEWFSTIPYKSHHDHAHDGCVENTGSWLFKRHEFIDWQQSQKPNLLWLHGIRETHANYIQSELMLFFPQPALAKLSLCEY